MSNVAKALLGTTACIGFLFVIVGLVGSAPSTSDNDALKACMTIANFKWSQSGPRADIAYEVTNNCTVPASPRVQIVVRDAAGGLVNVFAEYPSHVKNMKPGEMRPYTDIVHTDGRAAKIEYSIDDVTTN